MIAKKTIFVTGTDTGVGKTLLSALLLHHLRQSPGRTLAMKPFCSGGVGDVRLLQSLQRGELSDAEANPYYFSKPIAPLAAAKTHKTKVLLQDVVEKINHVKNQCDCLIIEGSGGLLVPLGEKYTVADLIAKLDCQVVVAARNQLGTINHTLLTVSVLRAIGVLHKNLSVILMGTAKPDHSSKSNQAVIKEILPKISVFALPYLGAKASTTAKIRTSYPKVSRILEKITPSNR